MDGRMEGWIHEWMMGGSRCVWMDEWKDGVDARMDGWNDRSMDGQIGGSMLWMDGWMDG